MDMNFTEVIDFSERLTVCAEISKEDTKRIFEENRETPKNDALEADDSFVNGELQFNFDEAGENLEEVLLFPTYEFEDDSITNGDFIGVTDQFSGELPRVLEFLGDYRKECCKNLKAYFEKVFEKAVNEALGNNKDNEEYTREDAVEEATHHFFNDSTDYDAVVGMYLGYHDIDIQKAYNDFVNEIVDEPTDRDKDIIAKFKKLGAKEN